jgi:hypothetical protein
LVFCWFLPAASPGERIRAAMAAEATVAAGTLVDMQEATAAAGTWEEAMQVDTPAEAISVIPADTAVVISPADMPVDTTADT